MEMISIRFWEIFTQLLNIALWALILFILVLVIRVLRKYLRSGQVRKEKSAVRRSLGEVLKAHRQRCRMTQEFVAESIGVSRQAVSKWENGSSDPSTSNVFALAKLYGVAPEELLRGVEREDFPKL